MRLFDPSACPRVTLKGRVIERPTIQGRTGHAPWLTWARAATVWASLGNVSSISSRELICLSAFDALICDASPPSRIKEKEQGEKTISQTNIPDSPRSFDLKPFDRWRVLYLILIDWALLVSGEICSMGLSQWRRDGRMERLGRTGNFLKSGLFGFRWRVRSAVQGPADAKTGSRREEGVQLDGLPPQAWSQVVAPAG